MKFAVHTLVLAASVAFGPLLQRDLRSLEHRCEGVATGSRPAQGDSAACLACHDGVIARGTTQSHGGGLLRTQQGGHPVMVSYVRAHQENPRAFVTPAALAPRFQLVDGRVECTTCHVISSRQEWATIAVLGRRDICLGCHQK